MSEEEKEERKEDNSYRCVLSLCSKPPLETAHWIFKALLAAAWLVATRPKILSAASKRYGHAACDEMVGYMKSNNFGRFLNWSWVGCIAKGKVVSAHETVEPAAGAEKLPISKPGLAKPDIVIKREMHPNWSIHPLAIKIKFGAASMFATKNHAISKTGQRWREEFQKCMLGYDRLCEFGLILNFKREPRPGIEWVLYKLRLSPRRGDPVGLHLLASSKAFPNLWGLLGMMAIQNLVCQIKQWMLLLGLWLVSWILYPWPLGNK